MKHLGIFLAGMITASCVLRGDGASIPEPNSIGNVYNSARIVASLIKEKKIHVLLDGFEPDDLEQFILNFSPANIAMQAEVFSCGLPVLVHVYDTKDAHYDQVHMLLLVLKKQYGTSIKCVEFSSNDLFMIAEAFGVEEGNVIFLFKGEDEIDHWDTLDAHGINEAVKKVINLTSS